MALLTLGMVWLYFQQHIPGVDPGFFEGGVVISGTLARLHGHAYFALDYVCHSKQS